jgi:hypothetical protein
MIIVEYTHNFPALERPLAEVPGTRVVCEQTVEQASGTTQLIVRVECPDFAAFDEALADDPGATNPVLIAEQDDIRLYRLDLTEAGMATNLVPVIIGVGGVVLCGVATAEGWRGRIRLPDRAALETVYNFNEQNGLEFTIHSVYEQVDWTTPTTAGLTSSQREILVAAFEGGYFEIPRDVSLGDLAASLGISETAASERFRRAMKNLVRETVYADRDGGPRAPVGRAE